MGVALTWGGQTAAGGTAIAADPATHQSPAETAQESWLDRDTLTGDWGGGRTWLAEHGLTLKPRLSQFIQGLAAGEGGEGFVYGGKADLLILADLSKLGLWNGLSLTVHAEQNFGTTVNGRGGAIIPSNVAMQFPGIEGDDASDLSSVYFGQQFGESVTLLAGKINIIDLCDSKPFMGGSGIESFWNTTFAAPPSGTVPPYLFGGLLSVKTEAATYGLWIYDPNSVVNESGLQDSFEDGVTFRGSVELPVTIFGRGGHQGFVALYSTKDGSDLETLDDILLPSPPPGTLGIKNDRYYFAYTFDQYLYQSTDNPTEGVGVVGQVGVSDGNPNRLYSSVLVGIGGVGLVPGRPQDRWGMGYYYDMPSSDLKDSLAATVKIRDEQGWELFYDVAVTPWMHVGADVQIIDPSLADDTAIFVGMRTVINF